MTAKARRGSLAYHSGVAAEGIVERAYEERGAEIIERRWRGRAGEIDLIARHQNLTVFIEVKASSRHDTAAMHLRKRQLERICLSACDYMAKHAKGKAMRIDLATVDGAGQVRVYENISFDL
ncbi:YraN family protein [Marivivens aquimaris]|uniref:YraN family protein n=1 Tax=Marivivens aquimaris TaxID=2774876 RepID=UPI00187EFCB7|nr:YraN family protein [Marivivens aquimaris]